MFGLVLFSVSSSNLSKLLWQLGLFHSIGVGFHWLVSWILFVFPDCFSYILFCSVPFPLLLPLCSVLFFEFLSIYFHNPNSSMSSNKCIKCREFYGSAFFSFLRNSIHRFSVLLRCLIFVSFLISDPLLCSQQP
jgi:hypothetical protein